MTIGLMPSVMNSWMAPTAKRNQVDEYVIHFVVVNMMNNNSVFSTLPRRFTFHTLISIAFKHSLLQAAKTILAMLLVKIRYSLGIGGLCVLPKCLFMYLAVTGLSRLIQLRHQQSFFRRVVARRFSGVQWSTGQTKTSVPNGFYFYPAAAAWLEHTVIVPQGGAPW